MIKHPIYLIGLLASLTVQFGCEEIEKVTDPILVELSETSITADGVSEITVTVRVNNNLKDEFRKVKLEVSGDNQWTATEEDSHEITANDLGVAQTKLQVGLIPGQFVVSCSIGENQDYFVESSFELTTLLASETLSLRADTVGVVANGQDRFLLTVEAPGKQGEKVELTLVTGSFDGENERSRQITIGSAGEAGVWVYTQIFKESYPVSAKLLPEELTIHSIFQVEGLPLSDVLSLTLSDTAGDLSDGISTFTVTAQIGNINTSEALVEFTVANGTVIGGNTSVPIVSGSASIQVQTMNAYGNIQVGATLNSPEYGVSEVFLPGISYPDNLTAIPAGWSSSLSNFSVSVDLYLISSSGSVTSGRAISADAYQLISGSMVSVGTFNPPSISSNTTQSASVIFSAAEAELDTTVPVHLLFTTMKTDGDDAISEFDLSVIP